VERLVDFASLLHHGCNIKGYYESQDLIHYFNMLNGPTYENLVKHFWVRASVFDKYAAKLEEAEKVLIDPTLEGKTREEMGSEPFVDTEIKSSIMGVPVFINQEIIAYVIGRASEGNFKDGLDNNKKSPWNDTVNETMFNSKKKGSYSNLSMEKKMMLKIQNENLLPKGGGSHQPSLEHKVFLHFFIKKEKTNVSRGFTDDMLDTVTSKIINGSTLGNMRLIKQEAITKLDIDLKKSRVSSNLMEGFPPICKQDPLDVQLFYIHDHLQSTREEIQLKIFQKRCMVVLSRWLRAGKLRESL